MIPRLPVAWLLVVLGFAAIMFSLPAEQRPAFLVGAAAMFLALTIIGVASGTARRR